MFQGQQGGVTQLAFSSDGTKLYSGGRKVTFQFTFLAWHDIGVKLSMHLSLSTPVSSLRVKFFTHKPNEL